MSFTTTSLGPIKVGSTVTAPESFEASPEVQSLLFRHSGNEFNSVIAVPGAGTRVRWPMPAKPALDLIGNKFLLTSTLELYLATFTNGLRSTGADHKKFALASGAKALVYIERISSPDRGIARADVAAILLSSDGMTYPLANPTDAALPAMTSGSDAIHTLGSTLKDGSAIPGCGGVELDFAPNIVVGIDGNPGDGLLYPTIAQYLGASPVINVEHADPVGVLASLGYTGSAIASNFVQWFRSYSGLAQATGFSVSVASGRPIPTRFGANNQQVGRTGFRIESLSASATHPWVVSTGSVP